MKITFEDMNGYVFLDERKQIWWVPTSDLHKPPQLLKDACALCGAGIFQTEFDDPFRDACAWHDNAYISRRQHEARGWDRKKIDDHFLLLMRAEYQKQRDYYVRQQLQHQAAVYYEIVRCLGWVYYYQH